MNPHLRVVHSPSATDLLAQARAKIEAAAATALEALREGAQQASDVCGDPTGQMLSPAVRDALGRLGELVRSQADKIERFMP